MSTFTYVHLCIKKSIFIENIHNIFSSMAIVSIIADLIENFETMWNLKMSIENSLPAL